METEAKRVVLVETPNLRLVKYENDNVLEFYKSFAPIPPYPNRVRTIVCLYKCTLRVHGEIEREGWNGKGGLIFLDFQLDEKTFNSILEAAQRVNDILSFEKFIEELEDIQRRLEDKALGLFGRMTAAFEKIQRDVCAQDKKPKKRKTKKAES